MKAYPLTTAPVLLTTRRFELVYPIEADLPALYPLYTDPRMMTHLGGPLARDFVEARIPRWQRHWEEYGYGSGIVRRKSDGVTVGMYALFHSEYAERLCLEVGWMVALAEQGKGVASEAMKGVIEYARAKLPAERTVVAFPSTTNGASNRVCEKLGFELVGEKAYPFDGIVLKTNAWKLELR